MPRAWSREQSQGGEVGEWAKPGLPRGRWPRCGVSLWGGCLSWGGEGEVIWHKLGVWSYQKGPSQVLHIPGISLTHPKDSKRSLSMAFPNLPLQTHSCGLSSCWQAPTPT